MTGNVADGTPAPDLASKNRGEPDQREPEGGDPACWLDRVCPECGLFAEEPDAGSCPRCGAELIDH